MLQFVSSKNNKSKPINQIMEKQVSETVTRTRKMIASILKPIKLCRQQNLSLWAKHLKETNSSTTGNVQALLNLMIESGDKVLEGHFKKAPKMQHINQKLVRMN